MWKLSSHLLRLLGDKQAVCRFAPSPSGRMHAGNIFAYLVAWLLTKSCGGKVLLRIEDLDPDRSKPEYIQGILEDFTLLGLLWDGDVVFQSKRESAYEKAFEQISHSACVYPCFCTRADIAAAQAPHESDFSVYPGTCFHLHEDERVRQLEILAKRGAYPSLRLHVPQQTIEVRDLMQGECDYLLAQDCGDIVLVRKDTTHAYHLAVVVDDAFSGVNLVVRGADLLSSAAIQIYLQQLLGYEQPLYAHVPLFCTSDGRRIAKRDKDASLDDLLAMYGSPQAVLGHIAWVSGLVETDTPYSAQELLECANLDVLIGRKSIQWES